MGALGSAANTTGLSRVVGGRKGWTAVSEGGPSQNRKNGKGGSEVEKGKRGKVKVLGKSRSSTSQKFFFKKPQERKKGEKQKERREKKLGGIGG